MAKSLFTNLKVTDDVPTEPLLPQPRSHKAVKTEKSYPGVSIQFEFESRDQARSVSRILSYQADRLRDQADKQDKNKLTYISEMLREQADCVEGMSRKIKQSVS